MNEGPARWAFRTLLASLGLGFVQAARLSSRFRAQITRDTVIEVRAADGPAWHYVFDRTRRTVSSRAGRAPGTADLSLCFASSWLAVQTLIRPDAIGRIVRLLLAGRATYTGNGAYVPWFWGLTRMVLPYGLQRRLKSPLPGALAAPNPASKVFTRVTREPVTDALDKDWTGAVAAHQTMPMVRGCAGDEIPMW